jgi:Histidine kinase-, DNA gyrase B-, and HSP90-like ATPase
MSSALVSLKFKEPAWARNSEPIFVGKDVLELLSSSMYVDPLSMYREYIQNAADAYDQVREEESPEAEGRIDIRIDPKERRIVITDLGYGLEEQAFYQRLTSIGGSRKRGTGARGFRGVGRLAGLAYCQELIFRTRPRGKRAIQEMRWDSRKIRELLRSEDITLNLSQVVSESVETRTIVGADAPEHFFEVELRGVVRHGNDRLLDTGEVMRYLSQVAPVPFHPDFSFGPKILDFLRAHGAHRIPLEIEIAGAGRVFRPHRDQLLLGNDKFLSFTNLETFTTQDRNGDPSTASWILHHGYIGALPKSSMVSGWRLRSGDIQVGETDLIEDLYPESRFNSWTVAESHILDRKIIPNGRRDNFEHNAYFADLLTRLTPHARNIAQLCRASSITRNLHARIDDELLKCEEKVSIAAKKRTPGAVVRALTSDVRNCLDRLEPLSKRSSVSSDERSKYEGRMKTLRSKLAALEHRGDAKEALAEFTPVQRRVLTNVFDVIYESSKSLPIADELIGKIISRVRKSR